MTAPFEMPPVAAVYVYVIVLPVAALFTDPVGVVNVPARVEAAGSAGDRATGK